MDVFTFEQIDKSISHQNLLVAGLDKGVQTLEKGRKCLNINFFYPPRFSVKLEIMEPSFFTAKANSCVGTISISSCAITVYDC